MREPSDDTVRHEVARGVATITLNRPDAGNALLAGQRDAIIEQLAADDEDQEVRVIVVRSNGRHFCSGVDLGSLRLAPGERHVGDGMRRIMQGAQRLVAAVLDCPKPVVAAVQGPAAGLGAHLAYACDLVVAADTAYFVESFLPRGIVVDAAGAYLLPRLVGMQRAKELAFLGDKLTASDAQDLGLVNRVVGADDLDATVAELSGRLASAATSAIGLTKRLFNQSFDHDRTTAFLAEAMAQELQSTSHDASEGITAFGERRDPRFLGH